MPDRQSQEQAIIEAIAERGMVSIADYMALSNDHYYGSRVPMGAQGDFVTSPEISQMFGEMIGIWIADLWVRGGQAPLDYVELGPGRGTLAADALRTMAQFGLEPDVHLVETSPILMAEQLRQVPHARHYHDIAHLPRDRALVIIANEFFDALPVQQYVARDGQWYQRMVAIRDGQPTPILGDGPVDAGLTLSLALQHDGGVMEMSPASASVMAGLAARIATRGGAVLTIDYGYLGPAVGDTLQAVHRHQFADPFAHAGEADLTAHVDFAALADTAHAAGAQVIGPEDQGVWLNRLGMAQRLQSLIAANPDQADALTGQYDRLTRPDAMGHLFKVMAVYRAGDPVPEGFLD